MDRQGVEGGAALGNDQQPDGSAPCRKRLLDRATTGYQLLVFTQQRLTVDGGDTCRASVKLWSAQDRAPIARLPWAPVATATVRALPAWAVGVSHGQRDR